jgi:hypothetical protein
MMLDIETKLYIEVKGLPSSEILSVSFWRVNEFCRAVYENEEYLIVADEDEGMNHIGVNKHGNVYLIFDNKKKYISSSLVKFIKQLFAFQSFKLSAAINSEMELKKRADELRETIKGIDKTSLKNNETFWSSILEHIREV